MVATAGYRTRLAHPEQPGHSIVPQGPPLRSKGKNSRFNGLMRRAREAEESPARTIDRQRYSSHHPGNTRSRRSQSLHVSSISSEEVGLKGSARSHAYASARTVPMHTPPAVEVPPWLTETCVRLSPKNPLRRLGRAASLPASPFDTSPTAVASTYEDHYSDESLTAFPRSSPTSINLLDHTIQSSSRLVLHHPTPVKATHTANTFNENEMIERIAEGPSHIEEAELNMDYLVPGGKLTRSATVSEGDGTFRANADFGHAGVEFPRVNDPWHSLSTFEPERTYGEPVNRAGRSTAAGTINSSALPFPPLLSNVRNALWSRLSPSYVDSSITPSGMRVPAVGDPLLEKQPQFTPAAPPTPRTPRSQPKGQDPVYDALMHSEYPFILPQLGPAQDVRPGAFLSSPLTTPALRANSPRTLAPYPRWLNATSEESYPLPQPTEFDLNNISHARSRYDDSPDPFREKLMRHAVFESLSPLPGLNFDSLLPHIRPRNRFVLTNPQRFRPAAPRQEASEHSASVQSIQNLTHDAGSPLLTGNRFATSLASLEQLEMTQGRNAATDKSTLYNKPDGGLRASSSYLQPKWMVSSADDRGGESGYVERHEPSKRSHITTLKVDLNTTGPDPASHFQVPNQPKVDDLPMRSLPRPDWSSHAIDDVQDRTSPNDPSASLITTMGATMLTGSILSRKYARDHAERLQRSSIPAPKPPTIPIEMGKRLSPVAHTPLLSTQLPPHSYIVSDPVSFTADTGYSTSLDDFSHEDDIAVDNAKLRPPMFMNEEEDYQDVEDNGGEIDDKPIEPGQGLDIRFFGDRSAYQYPDQPIGDGFDNSEAENASESESQISDHRMDIDHDSREIAGDNEHEGKGLWIREYQDGTGASRGSSVSRASSHDSIESWSNADVLAYLKGELEGKGKASNSRS